MEPAQNITYLTQDELRRLFGVIKDKQDRALFYLAYHHGLWASAVSLLQRADINDKQGRIYIHWGKGSISKAYPIQPQDSRMIHSYLHTRNDNSPYLFVTNRKMPLERRSYWNLLQKYGASAEVLTKLGNRSSNCRITIFLFFFLDHRALSDIFWKAVWIRPM